MELLSPALSLLLVAVVAIDVLIVGYLLFLTALAVGTSPTVESPGTPWRRFAVLVPAHDEELVIGRLLASLQQMDYPRDLIDVCVVADNCKDQTPSISRDLGARVYERTSSSEHAKGFALRWLLDQLKHEHRAYDAFVVIDADSVVAPNFLRSMDAHLSNGADAIQAYYSVLNPGDSAVAALRFAALAAVHYLRPLGRSRLKLSSGLKGNGMCFTAWLLDRFGWRWFTLAEDVEFHLALVAQGVRVEFAPDTWVKADMPATLRDSASQNERWERGRIQLLRAVPKLVWGAVVHRNWLELDAAIEQLIPPLSVPFAIGGIAIPAAWVLNAPGIGLVGAACLGGYGLYLVSALALVRAPVRIYWALGAAPLYIAWKLGLYAQSLMGARRSAWIRTARTRSAG
jgi:1,2-diacylglycerol 3-beta-glucosyltransferase